MTSPKWYDCTISVDNLRKSVMELNNPNSDVIRWVADKFDEKCDRYCIGYEIGSETGYEHLQCRIVLKSEWNIKYVIAWFPYGNWSPTSQLGRNFAYCEKEGKFFRSWEKGLRDYQTLEPVLWQEWFLEYWKKQNDRQILICLDKVGGHGKSTLRKMMVAQHMATYIPPMDKPKDIMRMAMAKPSKGYVIDLPRAEGKVNDAVWSAVEQLKDGYLYDDRYSFRDMWIEPPKVAVFCNDYEEGRISEDRVQPLDISDFQRLV